MSKLNMPSLLCSYVTSAFIPTIKVGNNVHHIIKELSKVAPSKNNSILIYIFHLQPPIPDPNNIRDFVSYPTSGNERLHCTMKRAEENPEAGGPCYTLYLEHLGGLVPILKGRRISKLRPEFVIMDPKMDSKTGKIYICNHCFLVCSDGCSLNTPDAERQLFQS